MFCSRYKIPKSQVVSKCTCRYQSGTSEHVHRLHKPPAMASLFAEHKESWRIVQAALEIKRLIAHHGISNAKFEKMMVKTKT